MYLDICTSTGVHSGGRERRRAARIRHRKYGEGGTPEDESSHPCTTTQSTVDRHHGHVYVVDAAKKKEIEVFLMPDGRRISYLSRKSIIKKKSIADNKQVPVKKKN
jgi:hypothetical protein